MANQKTKKQSTRKQTNRKSSVEKDEGLKPYQDEIILICSLVGCILVLLSIFNLCGSFGKWVNQLFFGLFGVITYIMPFGVFIGVAFYISNRGNRKAKRKLISVLALLVVLMALMQLMYAPYDRSMNIGDYYKVSSNSKLGGGMLGGTISSLLCSFLDEIGTFVVLIGIGALLVMFITEKLLFAHLGKKGAKRMQMMKERQQQRREEYEEERAYEKEPVKRKAKTFTIEREPKETIVPETGEIKNAKVDKRMKRSKKSSVDMEEIIPNALKEKVDEPVKKEKENGFSMPIYEEELLKKFNPVDAKIDDSIFHFAAHPEERRQEEKIEEVKQETVKVEKSVQNEKTTGVNSNKEMSSKRYDGAISMEEPMPVIATEVVSHQENTNSFESAPIYSDTPSYDINVNNQNAKDETISYDAVEEPLPDSLPDMSSMGKEKKNHTQSGQAGRQESKHQSSSSHGNGAGDQSKTETIQIEEKTMDKPYEYPSTSLLAEPKENKNAISEQELRDTAYKLHSTLESFGVRVQITDVSCGPTVTRYEMQPEQGVKVSKITGLADDIKLNLAAADIRIEAPIPGKAAVGIEVPNKENSPVMLRELLESKEFKKHSSNVAFAVGKDIGGKTVVTDIAKMPHLLIAGATGSGKSVCINTLIMSILFKANPNDVKLIMIDPKVVELSVYNGIPHLLIPVVTDPKKASAALNWGVMEMTERYNKFAELGVRDLKGYNAKVAQVEDLDDERFKKMPEIVIIVDELADLMMVAPGEVEESICRLAQLARAAGIHLIIATQRPSVNVITGVIKANIPSRIAFSVSSAVDSRTIIDGAGAEKLLGKGDMLFYPSGFPKPIRVQGAFVSDEEVSEVVEFLTKDIGKATYDNTIVDKITSSKASGFGGGSPADDRDEYFVDAAKFIIEKDKASIGMLQRAFKIGFNRASRIMEQLCDAGVVGEDEGTKPRKVIMSEEQFEQFLDECL